MSYKTWNDLITSTTVKDFLLVKPRPRIISVRASQPLKEVLQVLSSNSITSVPVTDDTGSVLMGFVDMLDIAGYALHIYNEQRPRLSPSSPFPSGTFFESQVKIVMNFSFFNAPVVISERSTVADLIKLFCDPRTYFRLHRIAVQSEVGTTLTGIVTKSDIINFAATNAHLLPEDRANKTVRDMGLIHTAVSVQGSTPFADALNLLYQNRLSGIGILDDNGRLVGNFSASDLRDIDFASFDFFDSAVTQFLYIGTKAPRKPLVYCENTTTLQDAIQLLNQKRVHRLYVVEPYSQIPLGVISMSDVTFCLM